MNLAVVVELNLPKRIFPFSRFIEMGFMGPTRGTRFASSTGSTPQ
jgi:hypothetical protein